jgi:SAM-dependent methyltransferase
MSLKNRLLGFFLRKQNNSRVHLVSAIEATSIENQLDDDHISNEFYLDENSLFKISGMSSNTPSWAPILHCEDKRRALILRLGEDITLSNTVRIDKDTQLYIRYSAGLPKISKSGLMCEVSLLELGNELHEKLICLLSIPGGVQSSYWAAVNLDVSFLAGYKGYLRLRCLPSSKTNFSNDRLAIADLCVAREDRLPLVKARSFHELRSRNEMDHFSNTYRHSMYSNIQEQQSRNSVFKPRPVRKLEQQSTIVKMLDTSVATEFLPLPNESPYAYASRGLAECILKSPPNFVERLKQRAATGEIVRVLSLCSGAARIEASYAAQVGSNVEWSLLDINSDLLGLASKQFPQSVKVDLIEGNVNKLEFSGEKWDIILCVSALHHVVELEKLIEFCYYSLHHNGQFWSIGEYVGKNGNRLWPDAISEANKLFLQLPEKYRINSHTKELDNEIPDRDYSVGCFEGIRSEDIEPILDRWFQPIEVDRRNCFLWRLINLAYSDNYDLSKIEDREWITKIISTEVTHFKQGGRGTELNGVYVKRIM